MRKKSFLVWVILLIWAHPFFIHSAQAETLSPDKGVEVMMLLAGIKSGSFQARYPYQSTRREPLLLFQKNWLLKKERFTTTLILR